MKKHLKLFIFTILVLACGKDKVVVLPENVNVTTVETFEVSTKQAKAKGLVKVDGKAAIKAHGHCWSATIAEPTPENGNKTDLGPIEAETNFISELKELKTNTTYFVRAYAFTQAGTYYGKVLTFKTSDLRAPIVTTSDNPSITTTTVTTAGQITDLGTSAVTNHGHVLSQTNQNPTIADTKTENGEVSAVPKDFTSSFSNLTANTQYYIRAYATSTVGTSYGKVIAFKTSDQRAPVVSTSDKLNIGTTTVGSSGQVTDLGTSPVTAHGHVLSQSNQNPTIADTKIDLGAVSAVPKDFTSNFSNLKANTKYYVRAFATSSVSTTYGKAVSFTTKAIAPPAVETQDIGTTTSNSTVIFASINSIGGEAVSQHGMCWSSTQAVPDINDTKNQLGAASEPKNYNATITGLASNTTYYIRAYATNSGGTAYGKVLTVKTNENDVKIAGQFWFGIYKNGPNSDFDQTPQANGIFFHEDGSFDFYSIIGFEKVGTWSVQGSKVNLFSEKYGINTSFNISGNKANNFLNSGRTLLSTLEKHEKKYELNNTTWEISWVNDDGAVVKETLKIKDNKFTLGNEFNRSPLSGDVYVFFNTVYFVVNNVKTGDRIYMYIYQNANGTQLMKGGYANIYGLYEASGIKN